MRHKHVAIGAPEVRSVTLLQNHDCVLHMVVHKMNPQVGLIWIPTQAPLYRASDLQQTFFQRDLLSLVLPKGGGGLVPLTHYMMALAVHHQ